MMLQWPLEKSHVNIAVISENSKSPAVVGAPPGTSGLAGSIDDSLVGATGRREIRELTTTTSGPRLGEMTQERHLSVPRGIPEKTMYRRIRLPPPLVVGSLLWLVQLVQQDTFPLRPTAVHYNICRIPTSLPITLIHFCL
ncbi:hypothetical protein K435DRAFT_89132 [Dendrothele bispora CBS 962.96]|uniref:Uncharacterized protein n=1 Tax=Dendrothele bispora (strain CBS 962.96) TaxID=1314807 RepID=A0A4S8KPF0_DENBC|nr:hypothetical protein K435DRAFT_89132 [Dendrothele bispora CBS 962.96]